MKMNKGTKVTPTTMPDSNNDSAVLMAEAITRIVVIREGQICHELLLERLEQTLRPHRDRPGVERALELGLKYYLDPTAPDVYAMRHRGHRAISYLIDSTLFVIWVGSADTVNASGDNPFVRYMTEQIRLFQPTELICSNLSRLGRSQTSRGRLRKSLIDARTTVVANRVTLKMGEQEGQMMWDFLAIIYSAERDAIKRRMILRQDQGRQGKELSTACDPSGLRSLGEGGVKARRPPDQGEPGAAHDREGRER